jgi:hypothetical protein
MVMARGVPALGAAVVYMLLVRDAFEPPWAAGIATASGALRKGQSRSLASQAQGDEEAELGIGEAEGRL